MKTIKLLLLISALTTSTGLLFGSSWISIPVERPIKHTRSASLFTAKKLTLDEVDDFVKRTQASDNKYSFSVIKLGSQEAQRLEEEASKPNIPSNEIENAYAYLLLLAQCLKHDFVRDYRPEKVEERFNRAEAFINATRTKEPKLVADLEDKALRLGLIKQKAKQPEKDEKDKTDKASKAQAEINKTQSSQQSKARLSKVIRWVGGGLAVAACAAAIWYFGFHNKKAAPKAKKAS